MSDKVHAEDAAQSPDAIVRVSAERDIALDALVRTEKERDAAAKARDEAQAELKGGARSGRPFSGASNAR